MKKLVLIPLILITIASAHAQQRIVSLDGTISEMLSALGLEQQIVGVDVTSTYPTSLKEKPKVSHTRDVSAEGVLMLRPTLVLGVREEIKPEVLEQLKAAKVKIHQVKPDYSIEGVRKLLLELASLTGTEAKGKQLLADFDQRMKGIERNPLNKKVLVVYARGAGSMTVCGTGSSPYAMIEVSGADNAIQGITNYKPLSAESLVAANPDVIVLFNSGLQSVGGIDGMLKVPGVEMTNAGKHKKIVSMDGHRLAGFGLQLPEAIMELRKKISE